MQVQKIYFLNSKEKKKFYQELQEQYGYSGKNDYTIFMGSKGKYYFISQELDTIPFDELRIKQGGLYVAQQVSDGIRLSMDGAILLAEHCSAPKINLNTNQREKYMKGEDVEVEETNTDWRIIECDGDILGCGKVKEGWLLNYVSKNRWILEPH